jgi:hypothetical protein
MLHKGEPCRIPRLILDAAVAGMALLLWGEQRSK